MNPLNTKCLLELAIIGLTVMLSCATPALAQIAPSLGAADSYAVLAGSAVSNTGSTTIIGDVGVSPGTAVTGFPPGTVTGGTIHINDANAQLAQSDLTTAYNFTAGQAFDTDLTGQDLGGLTLTSAVYHFSTSAQLTGTLTLDAQGNPDAVFIFQVGTTLTTASNARVLLINGASNCNVYWQVGSSATLGTATGLAGNILALTSITLTTGATVSGRCLARNGAVTLDGSGVDVCTTCNPINLSPATLPNGTMSVAYSQKITAAGGAAPYSFSIVSGLPPTGLSLSTTGILSGVPVLAGSFTFTVRAVDSAGCFGTHVYAIVINATGCPSILLSPPTLPPATAGFPYSQTITASGGVQPYVFTVTSGALPPGLELTPSGPASVLLSGTPKTPGSYTFTITATDANLCTGNQIYTSLSSCPTVTVDPPMLPIPAVGVVYNQTISASGGEAPYLYTVTAGSLVPGLSLSADGLLSGIPSTAGVYSFAITATDVNGCAGTRNHSFMVVHSIPTLSEWGLILLIVLLAFAGIYRISSSRQPA